MSSEDLEKYESEAELAFSALADLLAPLHDRLDRLPAPQARALAAALALGPPQPGERLAVCVATSGLLALAAAQRPVLAVVDDLQWIDAASLALLRNVLLSDQMESLFFCGAYRDNEVSPAHPFMLAREELASLASPDLELGPTTSQGGHHYPTPS